MYSSAASVTLGHHDRSNERSLRRFSAINSMPSSVILEQPDNDNTVKLGKVCTANNKQNCFLKAAIALIFFSGLLTYIDNAMVCDFPAGLQSQNIKGPCLFWAEVRKSGICDVIGL